MTPGGGARLEAREPPRSLALYNQQHGEYPAERGRHERREHGGRLHLAADPSPTTTETRATKDATHIYGPYLRKAVIPTEPMTESNVLEIETAGALGMTATALDPGGWKFDNRTGQLIVNDAAYDDR